MDNETRSEKESGRVFSFEKFWDAAFRSTLFAAAENTMRKRIPVWA
ncbi:MAG: hypothetical protein SOY64_10335 [Pyramidobacter sp.]|nr:hypothetical protein [Pyramidobacter sp.]